MKLGAASAIRLQNKTTPSAHCDYPKNQDGLTVRGEPSSTARRVQIEAAEDQREVGGLDLQGALVHFVGREL